jgi:perosamine synthetase
MEKPTVSDFVYWLLHPVVSQLARRRINKLSETNLSYINSIISGYEEEIPAEKTPPNYQDKDDFDTQWAKAEEELGVPDNFETEQPHSSQPVVETQKEFPRESVENYRENGRSIPGIIRTKLRDLVRFVPPFRPQIPPGTRATVVWMGLDSFVVFIAYAIAFSVRASTAPLDYSQGLSFVLFVTCVMLALLNLFGVYHRIWFRTSGHDVHRIIVAVLLATIITVVTEVAISDQRPLPLSVVLLGNTLALVGFVAVRYRSRLFTGLSWRWKAVWHRQFPQMPTRVLIVGAGEMGQVTAWRLKYRAPSDSVYHVVGFVDDDPKKRGMYIEGCPVLGTCADIRQLVERYNVDLVAIAIHNVSGPDFRKILSYCESTLARIKIIPDMFAVLSRNFGSPLLRDVQAEDILGRKTVGRHEGVDLEPVTHKVILVTGAAGSIGSELCRQLIHYQPVKLLLLDSNESDLHDLVVELADESTRGIITPMLADITNRPKLEWVFEHFRPQIVFHLAAYKHVPMLEYHPDEAIRVNIHGTRQVAEFARDYDVERFVLISTDKAVHPTSIMGASNRIRELLMHALAQQNGHKTLFTSVRFGNVLGSRGSVVPTFTRQIEAGGPVTVTDEHMARFFMTIPEAANLVIHAACLTKGNDLFLLRMGDEVRIVELAERMIRMRGLRPYEDIQIKFTGARSGEKLREELLLESDIPVETVHPNIIQLLNHTHALQPEALLAQVDTLEYDQWANGSDMRARLLTIANHPDYLAPPAPDDTGEADGVEQFVTRPTALSRWESGQMMNIPMSSPDITPADIDDVNEVMRTRWLSLGPKLDQFEGAFASYIGTKSAVGVNSGTSGLHLCMVAAGIGRGDEVITPSFSFIASTNCVQYTGAQPVFVDVDPLTHNMYPLALEEAITERTKAIIVVHAFGQPADMDPILDIACKHELIVIEDACEAIGAEYKERRVGTLADAAVFAFYPNKQMTTGEGGMIVSDNPEWLDLFRSLRNKGRDVFDAWLCHSSLGYNYRMDEVSAVLGLSQLQRIDELLMKRARVAAWYDQRIDEIPGLTKPYIAPTTTRMSWFVYVIRCSDHVDRNGLMSYLQERGVPSRPYFTPIHLQPLYRRQHAFMRGKLPNTEKAGDAMLALPFSSIMTEEQVEYVCEQLKTGVASIAPRIRPEVARELSAVRAIR